MPWFLTLPFVTVAYVAATTVGLGGSSLLHALEIVWSPLADVAALTLLSLIAAIKTRDVRYSLVGAAVFFTVPFGIAGAIVRVRCVCDALLCGVRPMRKPHRHFLSLFPALSLFTRAKQRNECTTFDRTCSFRATWRPTAQWMFLSSCFALWYLIYSVVAHWALFASLVRCSTLTRAHSS